MALKKVVYFGGLCCLILVASMAVSAINQKVIIDIPGSFILNGKNITVLGMGPRSINVDVDGVVEDVQEDVVNNLAKNVNGVIIHILALSRNPTRAVLNITVYITCGNNVCENGEDFTVCCADCGCGLASQICTGNRCMENVTGTDAKNQCYTDADCNDGNSCTTERCDTSEFPNRCVRTDITACIAGDQCCPKSCDMDKDSDCTQIDKCEVDADCTDNEICTQETCTGAPKRCQYAHQDGCTYQSACIVKGTVKEGKYCEGSSHEWLSQRVDNQPCTEDFECIAGICDSKLCGRSKSNTLAYAFYTVGLIAVIMILWYVSLTRKTKPSQQS